MFQAHFVPMAFFCLFSVHIILQSLTIYHSNKRLSVLLDGLEKRILILKSEDIRRLR